MAKFCGKCGSKLDETTGLCPNCQANVPAQPISEQPKADDKQEKKPGKKKPVLLIVILAVIVVAAAAVLILIDWDGNDGGFKADRIDADAYYQENATVLEKIPAKESKDVLTEKQAVQIFMERGFDQSPIKTEYSMDGVYQEATEVTGEDEAKHPKYYCNYITENGDYWTIVILNGQIMASPVSYNLQSQRKVAVVFAESTTVTAYDSTTNTFFEIIPGETMLTVIKVDRIDAQTLEMLTSEEIDGL